MKHENFKPLLDVLAQHKQALKDRAVITFENEGHCSLEWANFKLAEAACELMQAALRSNASELEVLGKLLDLMGVISRHHTVRSECKQNMHAAAWKHIHRNRWNGEGDYAPDSLMSAVFAWLDS